MLEEQVRKSANRCQRFVLNRKVVKADSNLQVMGVALTYTIRRKATLTLPQLSIKHQAPINIHIQIVQNDLHTFPLRIS